MTNVKKQYFLYPASLSLSAKHVSGLLVGNFFPRLLLPALPLLVILCPTTCTTSKYIVSLPPKTLCRCKYAIEQRITCCPDNQGEKLSSSAVGVQRRHY